MTPVQKCLQIQNEIATALAIIAEKHQLELPKIDLRVTRDGSFYRLMKIDINQKGVGIDRASVDEHTLLADAIGRYNINSTTNAKGDELISFNPRAPKYCFQYRSIRGTIWNCTAVQAKARFS